MSYSVGELAGLARVSIRTLHHYDHIGLLRPSGRSSGGYRQYSAADAARLHQIRVYRALGFDLARIGAILDDPAVDAEEQLRRQHVLLAEELGRLQLMLEGVEALMNAKKRGYSLSEAEMKEVFGSFDPREHEAEVKERWGKTAAYRRSQERTARYGKAEWLELKAEAERISQSLIETMRRGLPADSPEAMQLAESHRQHITRWFYDCGPAMHRALGEMYVADPRFAAHYEEQAPGLSTYLRDAIVANAAQAGRD